MKKKKKEEEETSFKYYYKELLKHEGFTIHDKYNKNIIIFLVMALILLVMALLLLVFKDSKAVIYLFGNIKSVYWMAVSMCIYFGGCGFIFVLYHIFSIRFEHENRHEWSYKKGNKIEKVIFIIMVVAHFFWILCAVCFLKIIKKVNLYNLKESIPIIIGGYCWSTVLVLITLEISFKYLIEWNAPVGNYFTEKTYTFFLVFVLVIVFGKIPYYLLKWTSYPLKRCNKVKYDNIFKEYQLLNKYIVLFATFFLQAFEFGGEEEMLVNSLFYVATISALIGECKKTSGNS